MKKVLSKLNIAIRVKILFYSLFILFASFMFIYMLIVYFLVHILIDLFNIQAAQFVY